MSAATCMEEDCSVVDEAKSSKAGRGIVVAMVILTLATAACAMLSGCGTTQAARGKFALVEWDSRDKDQIATSAEEYRAFYGGAAPTNAPAAQSRSFTAWAELFEMITKLKLKLSVIKIEWQADPAAPEAPAQ